MTIDTFLTFTEARSGDDRWELIDGAPVMNPSPSFTHQTIADNLLFELKLLQRQGSAWLAISGFGVKLSQTDMPVPDVLIRPRQQLLGHFCDDMIVAFEVLSPSSRATDLRWKRKAYPKLPSLQHYVVLHQDERAIRCYDRADGWAERRLGSNTSALDLSAIGVSLSLAALYVDTGL